MFGLPERTIYFIYSGYFLLFAAIVLTYGGIINKNQKNEDKEKFESTNKLVQSVIEELKNRGLLPDN